MSREAHPDLIEILSNFKTSSFTELQAAAYIALLKMGEESGSAVAKESGINRSKIYDILNDLVDMNAVNKVSRNGKTRYVAVSPNDFFPKLLDTFESDITSAKNALEDLQHLQEDIDPVKFTIESIGIDDLDPNNFDYLISSHELSRVKYVEKLDKELRPEKDVRILDLNADRSERGHILLVKEQDAYIFGTPIGKKFDAIHISSDKICQFIIGLIESHWVRDIPPAVMNEIHSGKRRALVVDKAINVTYELYPRNLKSKYERPVSLLLTDEHISFFYEGNEEKIPLNFLSRVELLDNSVIRGIFFNNQNEKIGELTMRALGSPVYLANIMRVVSER